MHFTDTFCYFPKQSLYRNVIIFSKDISSRASLSKRRKNLIKMGMSL